ncbi:DUF3617 domain-containing protein [Bradyrhizobium sp. 2TAF24]
MSRVLGAALICVALPAAAHAEELPTRKAGLWDLKVAIAGGQVPAMTIQQCTDETTDKQMVAMAGPMQRDTCADRKVQKTATGFVVDAQCAAAGVSMTSHAEIAGDFNSAYTARITSQQSGGPAAVPRETAVTVDAKWLGACKPDQKPGDVVMPGGMKVNIKDLEAAKSLMRKP